MFYTIAMSLAGNTRLTVTATERVIALSRGRFLGIYGPGEHWLPGADLVLERHDIATTPRFASRLERALFRALPATAEANFTVVAAAAGEVAIVSRDGAPFALSRDPGERVVLWTDAGPWEVERLALGEDRRVPPHLVRIMLRQGLGWVTQIAVPRGHVGLVTIDGRAAGVLPEGNHLYWKLGEQVAARNVDTRWVEYDVTGQELLTRDRVTIRVNIAARYRVIDPVTAVASVGDFTQALHRALQIAFRRTLGTRTLDQLLAEKVTVDEEPAQKVRAEMAEIGLEVGEITLKDVILPGEMREILNRVVAAEKEAEANIIRRREETAATRQLLNTAKIMAENPVMLRLKELEALDAIAGKVGNLTVMNGTEGLMKGIVRLTD